MSLELLKKKSTWTMIAGAIVAAGAYVSGEISLLEFGAALWTALAGICFRDAIRKVEK